MLELELVLEQQMQLTSWCGVKSSRSQLLSRCRAVATSTRLVTTTTTSVRLASLPLRSRTIEIRKNFFYPPSGAFVTAIL